MPKLKFHIIVDGVDEEAFVVHKFSGIESLSNDLTQANELCCGYHYQIDLASRRSDIEPDTLIDQNVRLELRRNGVLERTTFGIVKAFSKGDTGHHHTFYSLQLVPSLERLSLRHNSRIFQYQSAPEIISVLLQEMGISDYAFSLQKEYPQREYCVQYRETDLDFIHRLMSEEGMIYSFDHEQGQGRVVFSDVSTSLAKLDDAICYAPASGGEADSTSVSSLKETKQFEVSDVTLNEHSFLKPSYRYSDQQRANDEGYQDMESYQHFDFLGDHQNGDLSQNLSQTRLEALRRYSHIAEASSDEMRLKAGMRFTLSEHIDQNVCLDWQVVSVIVQAEQPQALEEEGGVGATTYHNELLLIPASKQWKLLPQLKPIADGSSIATVVGPEGEDIYTDEFGRVKLHFPWDRYSNGDEHSSCWVRVSQSWAGSQYGMVALPRVGQEVIVSFLNGDPDQPIVTGRTYNANNPAPYELPEHKTKTVFRTETYQGSGFNELSFEDQAGREQIYIHGQKDFKAKVKNDVNTVVHNDHHLLVENDQFGQIVQDKHLTIDGESRVNIKGNMNEVLDSNLNQQLGEKICAEAGREISFKSGAKIVVEAGAEITLKAGGSFVTVDGSGVSLSGPAINLNAGGSAGQGSAYSGLIASLPNGVEAPAAPEVAKSVRHQALLLAEESRIPLVKPCPQEGTK
ncbi:type VI secretion system tip protein TssI/VgrG [Vibrio hepatarius]|uniref:type VI secretion system tip protein TssI/VgrG n=1 Tax=Vibrio hepatarius TaxID=171383 RepID=UPI003734E490